MASKKRPVKASKKRPKKAQKPGVPLLVYQQRPDSDDTAVIDALALREAGRAVKLQVDKLMHVIKAVDAGPDIQEARISAVVRNWVTIKWDYIKGFGELTIKTFPSGKTEIWTKGMSREFVKAVLNKLVDDAEIVPL